MRRWRLFYLQVLVYFLLIESLSLRVQGDYAPERRAMDLERRFLNEMVAGLVLLES